VTVRRFVQQPDGELVEVGLDYVPVQRASNRYVGDGYYDGLRAQDGADISTRTKHREYMKRHGLTTVDDYKGEFIRRGEARRRFHQEGYDPTRRPMVARAVHEAFDRAARK
jgi:hypothetical protein